MTLHRDVRTDPEQLAVPESDPFVRSVTDDSPLGPVIGAYKIVTDELAIAASVTVIIPAKNEAANLPYVFATLPRWVDEVVLVDGRSTDDTVDVARRLCPTVKVVEQTGDGKGDALLAGFAASSGEIIVTMDADGSTDGREILRFVAALITGADFVKGSRFAASGCSDDITAARRFGNRLLSGLVNLLFGTRYTDLCYGFNAFWSRHLKALDLDCSGFEVETLMNIRAVQAGLVVHEVPSFERRRVHGTSNLRILVDGWRIIRLIGTEWRQSRELRRKALKSSIAARERLDDTSAVGELKLAEPGSGSLEPAGHPHFAYQARINLRTSPHWFCVFSAARRYG